MSGAAIAHAGDMILGGLLFLICAAALLVLLLLGVLPFMVSSVRMLLTPGDRLEGAAILLIQLVAATLIVGLLLSLTGGALRAAGWP
jgi:hypothetical protein